MRLEASTKPHVPQKFEIFWTNIASTMAYPMSKNGPKKGLCPLGLKYKKASTMEGEVGLICLDHGYKLL
jgi:hypothetical protein